MKHNANACLNVNAHNLQRTHAAPTMDDVVRETIAYLEQKNKFLLKVVLQVVVYFLMGNPILFVMNLNDLISCPPIKLANLKAIDRRNSRG